VPRKTVHQHKVEIHTLKDKEAAKAEEVSKMKKEETLGPSWTTDFSVRCRSLSAPAYTNMVFLSRLVLDNISIT